MRRASLWFLLLLFLTGLPQPATASPADCGDVTGTCGVTGSGTHFHGVLAVTGASWVLDASASTDDGCGDCSWSMVPACITQHVGQPDTLCDGAGAAPACDPGQVLYRIYLSTTAFVDRDEGVVCIGGSNQPVPIGEISVADVGRYLDNVRPPELTISTRPQRATLAGFLTYFRASPPGDVRPSPFGGPDVMETITIAPTEFRWRWGDATGTDWTTVSAVMPHRYLNGGVVHGTVTTRWHATYTVSYAGRTFGPYDADREITRAQNFRLPVHTSTPVLVSR